MTAPAKPLTNRAKLGNETTYSDLASTARVFLDALGRLGYEKRTLLMAAGVDLQTLDDPDARVPCEVIGKMFGCAMQIRPLKNLGTKIAAETPMGAFPLLDYLIVTCGTVAEGMKQLSRYLHLTLAPYSLELREDGDSVRVIFHPARPNCPMEFGVSLTVLRLREETGNRLSPRYVNFTHSLDDVVEMERVLGCPVERAEWDGFALSRESWECSMPRRDPVLRGVLEHHAGEIAARLPPVDDMTSELRQVLWSRITQGETDIEGMAHALAISTRSLQRRLAAAGTSYQELLDATRREAAARYLEDRSLSLGEIAYLLGYSEPAAFHRAFKRWTGTTPQEFRRQKAGQTLLTSISS